MGQSDADEQELSFRDWLATRADRLAAAAVLLRATDGRLLILRPTYKPGWTVPGGVVEPGELPVAAARREVREETGLEVVIGRLLVVEHRSATSHRPASVHFVFDATTDGPLEDLSLVLPPDEIAESRLAPSEVALDLLNRPLATRVAVALRASQDGRTAYLEDGRVHAG